jgi:uncharacterized protein YgiM (DUF1202 family)
MKTPQYLAAAALVGAMALPGAASAQQMAFTTTDLNMRTGPSPDFAVVTVIPANSGVGVLGCTETMTWCQVSFAGITGWAYAPYLAVELAAAPPMDDPRLTAEDALLGGAEGAISGAIAGGPVGAAIGGVAGLFGPLIFPADDELLYPY